MKGLAMLLAVASAVTSFSPLWAQPVFQLKWGSFGSGDGQFNEPRGLAANVSGEVYVVDRFNHRIQKFDSTGTFLLKWGTSGSGNGQFNTPADIAVDDSGNVYVTDQLNKRVQKFDENGTFLLAWGSPGTGDGQFGGPGNCGPVGIAVGPGGDVYVADVCNRRVQKFDRNGGFILKWGSEGSGNGQFNLPIGLAVDADTNVYVADESNHRIQKFDANGTFLLEWGSEGSGPGQFVNPNGIATDGIGALYVADTGNNRIQKFDGRGTLLVEWGSSGTGDGQFRVPWGIAVGIDGSVYVADRDNHRVQRFRAGVPPNANLQVVPSSGTAPLAVIADASGSVAVDGAIVSFKFDFGDGTIVGPQPAPTAAHTFAAGIWTVTVTVTDADGDQALASTLVTVVPAAPCSGPVSCPLELMPFGLPPSSTHVGPFAFDLGGTGASCFPTAGLILGAAVTQLQSPSITAQELVLFSNVPAIETVTGTQLTTRTLSGAVMHAAAVACEASSDILAAEALAVTDSVIAVVNSGGPPVEFPFPAGVTPLSAGAVGSCDSEGGIIIFSLNVQLTDHSVHSVSGGARSVFQIPAPIVAMPATWSDSARAGLLVFDATTAYVIEAGAMNPIPLGGTYISHAPAPGGVIVIHTSGTQFIPLGQHLLLVPFEPCASPMVACAPTPTISMNVANCLHTDGRAAIWPPAGGVVPGVGCMKITLSDAFAYEDWTFDDFAFVASRTLPIRFADVNVEAINLSKSAPDILAEVATDAGGGLTRPILADDTIDLGIATTNPALGPIQSRCLASSSRTPDLNVEVRDPAAAGAPLWFELTSPYTPLVPVIDLGATPWIAPAGGSGGAFNIFDLMIDGSNFVRQVNALQEPELVTAYWALGQDPPPSPNAVVPGNPCLAAGMPGGVPRSYYDQDALFIRGDPLDPDEYDDTVILHEYGHAVEDQFWGTRRPHEDNHDLLPPGLGRGDGLYHHYDPRLALSEGFATYFALAVLSTVTAAPSGPIPHYVDLRPGGSVFYDLETGSSYEYNSFGSDHEVSVAMLLWDIADGAVDDNDAWAAGHQPIWQVFDLYMENDNLAKTMEDFYNGWLSLGLEGGDNLKREMNGRLMEFIENPHTRVWEKVEDRPIPGNGEITSTLDVPSVLSIANDPLRDDLHKHKSFGVVVYVEIDHPLPPNLSIKLTGPRAMGPVVQLFGAGPGVAPDIDPEMDGIWNFGRCDVAGGNSYGGLYSWFGLTTGPLPPPGLPGRLPPHAWLRAGNLLMFSGENLEGEWTLTVENGAQPAGRLRRWRLALIPSDWYDAPGNYGTDVVHYNHLYEWLGPANQPGASHEIDVIDPDDQDLIPNHAPVDTDLKDDGVVIHGDIAPGGRINVTFTVATVGAKRARYLHPNGMLRDLCVRGWFDWNQDGVFQDPLELEIDWENSPATWSPFRDDTTVTVPVVVPRNAKAGVTWARFRLAYNCGDAFGPMGPQDFGEVEDYKIVVNPAPVGILLCDWINDTFPANEDDGLLQSKALFDTTAALIKTGRNIAQETGDLTRPNVPGDSVVINGGTAGRVDMVFRVLPGPGNYHPIGDVGGSAVTCSQNPGTCGLLKSPDQRGMVSHVVSAGDGSWWGTYLQHPGDYANPPAPIGPRDDENKGGWNPNAWVSARMDTAEANLYAFQGRGVQGGPVDPAVWMSTYHESDPKFGILGIDHFKCFVRCSSCATTNIVCDGSVPIVGLPGGYLPPGTPAVTKEGTKIIPDGLLTPGAHVQYFFRTQEFVVPGLPGALLPDSSLVLQPAEGSSDGHRWQQFSVLPDRWKDPQYFHPVYQRFGRGPAALLVIDNNDERGDERVWVSIADSIGATAAESYGAHNGWHAAGGQDVDDPGGFVSHHGGQPGTTWDLYQVGCSVAPTEAAATIGSRLSNRGNPTLEQKSSRQGPTPEMLKAFYPLVLVLTGDLNEGILGPFENRSQDDCGILQAWLGSGDPGLQNRGLWVIGDGFVEANDADSLPCQKQLLSNYLGVGLQHPNYADFAGVHDELLDLRVLEEWPGLRTFGIRNLETNDVLSLDGIGVGLGTIASEYDSKAGGAAAPASVLKDWSMQSPWKSLVEGWSIQNLTHRNDVNTVGRSAYFYQVLTNVWAKISPVAGTPIIPLDVPTFEDGASINFVNLQGNPLASGSAKIAFGLAKADRVEIKIYDIGGRLVRTLVNREFGPGMHEVLWDGTDGDGRQLGRGVYFTRVRYEHLGRVEAKKLVILK